VKTSLAVPAPAPTPHKIAVAANDRYINNHMVIQRTASAQPNDVIGALIDNLGSRP
jgi:hypothetical protein